MKVRDLINEVQVIQNDELLMEGLGDAISRIKTKIEQWYPSTFKKQDEIDGKVAINALDVFAKIYSSLKLGTQKDTILSSFNTYKSRSNIANKDAKEISAMAAALQYFNPEIKELDTKEMHTMLNVLSRPGIAAA